jgi:hypothetical protein
VLAVGQRLSAEELAAILAVWGANAGGPVL